MPFATTLNSAKKLSFSFSRGCLVFFFLLFMLPFTGKSQKTIALTKNIEDYVLNENGLAVFEDSSRSLTIHEISKPFFKGFHENAIEERFNRNTRSIYWLRFRIRNTEESTKHLLLESYAPHSNQMELFYRSGNTFVVHRGGENYTFDEKQYRTKNMVFDLPAFSKGEEITFFIRIDSRNHSPFDFRIKTLHYFLHYITNEYYFLGIYYGILFIMMVYQFLVYATVKENAYLYYILYVLCSALVTMTDDGLGAQYLWPDMPSLSRPMGYTIAPIALMIAFVLYASSFLDLKKRFRNLWKLLYAVTAIYLLYFTISTVLTGKAVPILYTIPFVLSYLIAWVCYRKGYKAARFFIVGYTCILCSIIVVQLRAEHILEGNFFTVYILNIGLLFEVVIFSFALSDRIRIIKKEEAQTRQAIIEALNTHKILQEKVNLELEEKVRLRTEELNKKNEELESINLRLHELNGRMNEANVKLDYDNWHLKKDIKNDLQSRILEEEVSYEEFQKIFPDEHTCMRYLAAQKWEHFYRCRKCGNLKYTESPDHSKRKCTVCGFVESATANTLFHGVRFPLNKAFYLAYLFYKKSNRKTLSELSELLEIRRNTCGSFRMKVNESREQYRLHHKNKPPESWEQLISVRKPSKT